MSDYQVFHRPLRSSGDRVSLFTGEDRVRIFNRMSAGEWAIYLSKGGTAPRFISAAARRLAMDVRTELDSLPRY